MRKTYKFKATANETTAQNAERWLYLSRQLYNAALEQRIIAYKRCGVTLSTYSQSNELPELKAECPEFKQVGSQVLQDVIERMGKAFQGFFSRLKKTVVKAGFPRFRSRARYDSFTLKQAGWKLNGRHLKIKGMGTFKLFLSREIQGRIKTVTVRRDACGERCCRHPYGSQARLRLPLWWVCFSCDEVPPKVYPESQSEVVGIDLGLNAFCTDTEGLQIANPKYYREAQADLRRRQRKVARRKKGSNRRKKAVRELARAHRRVKNLRLDFLHKTANHYIQKFKTICVEKLNIRNMVKNRHLSKSISDAGWGTFVELLLCKAAEAGREVIQVDPKGTSQNCSSCGETVKKSLAVRIHHCPQCGLELDRDENAARNIAAKATTGAGLALQALT